MARSKQAIKLYRRLGKKHYLKGKHAYEHERIYVPIPKRFHDKIKYLLNHKLDIDLTDSSDGVLIALHPRKNNSARRKHPDKNQPKPTSTRHFYHQNANRV